MPPPRFAPSLAFALLLGAARTAHADVEDSESNYDPGPAERRFGFAMGLLLGGTAGASSGYPNSLAKIDDPKYEADTGFAFGPAAGLWLGGALRDWFVFGVGLSHTSLSGGGVTSASTVYLAHLEGYPLFSMGGAFRDLGLVAEFGAGGRTIEKNGESVADGGAMSSVSFGAVYEPLRLGKHFSLGPSLMVGHQFSQSLDATMAVLGLRIVYYGGPS